MLAVVEGVAAAAVWVAAVAEGEVARPVVEEGVPVVGEDGPQIPAQVMEVVPEAEGVEPE